MFLLSHLGTDVCLCPCVPAEQPLAGALRSDTPPWGREWRWAGAGAAVGAMSRLCCLFLTDV